VSRLRFVLLAVLALAVAVVVGVGLFARGEHASTADALPKGKLLAAAAALFPQSLLFGQPVHVQIDAVLDRRKLDPRRLRLDAKWSPYTPIAPMALVRRDVGNYTRLRWRIDLHCVQLSCVPRVGSNVRTVFEPTTVRYVGSGTAPSVSVSWPTLIASSRLDPTDQERKAVVRKTGSVAVRQNAAFVPPWHLNTGLAAVSYRVAPNVVFLAALALALGLVLTAAAVLRPYLPMVGGLHRAQPSKLERAIEAVERARGRMPEERKALELLAAELRSAGQEGLSWAATELAWSRPVPEPRRTGELTETIRRELAGRTNGRRA
jgi:hypothetical protein